MVKIVKNGREIKVTKGAFEDIYAPLGYKVMSSKKVEVKPVENEIKKESKVFDEYKDEVEVKSEKRK